MAKTKTKFFCTQCGYESAKWMGKCPGCGEWNSMEEEPVGNASSKAGADVAPTRAQRLSDVPLGEAERLHTGIEELDRVLGGGLVPGSLVLVGGDPGIGKSTLWLQALGEMGAKGHSVLYISAEESAAQIKARAGRLGVQAKDLFVLAQTKLENVESQLEQLRPAVVVVDSIQTVFSEKISSAPGSVTQVRECATRMMRLAKEQGAIVVLIGHVTKEGALAGPRVLEHMVDTVLYFEGERNALRVLRTAKNRFGSTQEIGVFEMRDSGMRQVSNPSELFLSDSAGNTGSAVVCTMEGTRPILVEVQALTARSAFSVPRRTSHGLDYARAVLLTAVLEKRAGLSLYEQDVYINVAGGLRLVETAADLGVLMALVSCVRDVEIPSDMAFVGEVGLGGEVRQVSMLERRIVECAKLGFSSVMTPKLKGDLPNVPIRLVQVENVRQAMHLVLALGKKQE